MYCKKTVTALLAAILFTGAKQGFLCSDMHHCAYLHGVLLLTEDFGSVRYKHRFRVNYE